MQSPERTDTIGRAGLKWHGDTTLSGDTNSYAMQSTRAVALLVLARSADTGAGETLANAAVVVLFLSRGPHQLVVDT